MKPLRILPVSLVALLTSCLSIDAPPGFLEIDAPAGQLKLLTADEAKLWVREFTDSEGGTLEFWADALQNDLIDNRGYTLIEARETSDAVRRPAREWRYEMTVGGRVYGFLVSLCRVDDWGDDSLRISQFVAEKSQFDTHLEEVRKAIASVGP